MGEGQAEDEEAALVGQGRAEEADEGEEEEEILQLSLRSSQLLSQLRQWQLRLLLLIHHCASLPQVR